MIPTKDRLVRLLMESYDMSQADAQAFLDTLVPSLDLARIPFEDRFPHVRYGVGGGPVAGGVGNPSTIQLRNPPASNALVVIELLSLHVQGNVLRTGFATTQVVDNVGTLTRMMRDRRGGDAGLVATLHGANNVAASIVTVAETYIDAGNPLRVDIPVWVVLPAGVFFNLESEAANVAIRGYFRWYEFDLRVR